MSQPAAADSKDHAAWRRPATVLLAVGFVILRIPSLAEPTWYSDEGTYADVGTSLLRGLHLYSGVWDNKPPIIYWMSAAIVAIGGPSGLAFHVAIAAIVAAAAVATWRLGRRWGGEAGAALACGIVIVLMSLPNLDGDLFNAELIGATAVLWAVVLVVDERDDAWRPMLAGLFLAVAMFTKAVFVLDAAAVLAIAVWASPSSVRSRRDRQVVVLRLVSGVAGASVVIIAALAATGSVGGLIEILLTKDVGYLQRTASPTGGVISAGGGGAHATVLLLSRVVIPPLAGFAVAYWLVKRGRPRPAMVVLWLSCAAAGVMTSGRGFPHYAQELSGVLALAASAVALSVWRRGGVRRAVAVLVVVSVWPLMLVVLLIPRLQAALVEGERMPPIETDTFRASDLPGYYARTWQVLTGGLGHSAYESTFPFDPARLRTTVAVLKAHSRPDDRVFVWGNLHWAYALSHRLPAGRYVSLNSAYATDGGAQRRLLDELRHQPPVVLVAEYPPPAELVTWMRQQGYQLATGAAGGADLWLAPRALNN